MITKHDDERIKRLYKRIEWLRTRIYQTGDDKDLSYDRAELGALEWGVGLIEQQLRITDRECSHLYALITGHRVFCTRCLITKTFE